MTSPNLAPRRPPRLILTVCILCAFAAAAFGQDRNVAARFPDAARVAEDYPDAAERYAALKFLNETLRERTPGGGWPGAYAKNSAYVAGLGAVMASLDARSRSSFDDRVVRLFRDAAFHRAVLARYRLTDVVASPPPKPNTVVQNSGDVTDDMIRGAALRAAPFAIAALSG